MSIGRGDLEAGIKGLALSLTKSQLEEIIFRFCDTNQLIKIIDYLTKGAESEEYVFEDDGEDSNIYFEIDEEATKRLRDKKAQNPVNIADYMKREGIIKDQLNQAKEDVKIEPKDLTKEDSKESEEPDEKVDYNKFTKTSMLDRLEKIKNDLKDVYITDISEDQLKALEDWFRLL